MFKYPITVTLDTNVLYAAKYDLSKGSAIQLLKDYVKEGKIKVVISNIVIREAKRHIAKQVSKICSIARSFRADALKESTEYLIRGIGLNRLLEIPKDKAVLINKSEELFDDFIYEIDAEILGTDLINLDSIIDDYFKINPPFEEGEKKRKEFPDAFIAEQIKKRFGEAENVVIISNDKGFIKACRHTNNHIFFNSLREFYNAINKEEEAYAATISVIEEMQFHITTKLLEYIKENNNIEVRGISYDKDGIETGFDYSEIILQNIANLSFHIHSVDKVSEKNSISTLSCEAKIIVDCYYEDYDNAPWDDEIKDYIFVDTKKIREEHKARFGCGIEIDRNAKTFKFFPFTVILGGDSRKERYELEDSTEIDFLQELNDMDRESVGLKSLGSYESYLEDDLLESKMFKDIIDKFEEVNALYCAFEDFSIVYDSLLEKLKEFNGAKVIIKSLSEELAQYSDFPNTLNGDNTIESDIETIKKWASARYDATSEIADQEKLPDVFNYGTVIDIKGVDGSKITFAIDKIEISPTEGCEETIGISLSNEQGVMAHGQVKLSVGYLNFNKDGGVSDGLDDDIEYNYHEIIEQIENYLNQQREKTERESTIVKIIERLISNNNYIELEETDKK